MIWPTAMASIVDSNTGQTVLMWLMALAYSTAGAGATGTDSHSQERVKREDAHLLDQVRAAAGTLNAYVAAAAHVEVLTKLSKVPKIADFHVTKKLVRVAHVMASEKINDAFGLTSNVQSIRGVIVH